MNTREDKPKAYFSRLLDVPDEEIDYGEIPPTSRADWENAEVLLPVTVEEFQAIKKFLRDRRRQNPDTASHAT
jgi:hypothetical protein